jgi:hypothetical protein
MNWDPLFHWMTHLGEGSWNGFKDAVARLAPQDDELDDLLVRLRLHLSDMSHAEFFVDCSRRWRVLPPVLAGLCARPDAAVLCGGRTPRLTSALAVAAEAAGCLVSSDDAADGPTTVSVSGDPSALSRAAAAVGLQFVGNYASTLCRQLIPVYELLERAPKEPAPMNWSRKSFDFDSMSLVEGFRPNSACECSPRRGLPRWYVHTRRGRLRPMPKREAIYTAAMLQQVTLLQYDLENRRLLAPVKAPPPELYSRVACLCDGRRGHVEGRLIVFEEVPPDTAAVLCVAAGQPHPGVMRSVIAAANAGNYHGQPV